MNTRILMIASSVFYGIIGFGFTFLPKEIAQYIGTVANQNSILVFQLLGAVYLGFGMLNWMTRNNLIGGIYSRPLILGNLVHFLVSFFALVKVVFHAENSFGVILVLTIFYAGFTLFFGYVLMTNPGKLLKRKE